MVRKFLRGLAAAILLLLIAESINLMMLARSRATITGTSTTTVALGNGATTVFSFPFVGVAAADITVIFTDASGNQTTLNQGTQYTVQLNAPASGALWGIGGTVTYPLAGSPIASGTTLTITRNLPLTQTVSSNHGQVFSLSLETALDLVTMQVQQINAMYGRSIAAPVTDTCGSLGNLPVASQRANQMLGFDGTGCNPVTSQPASAPVSAAMQPVVNAASIAAANNLLGVNTNFNVPVGAEVDWPSLTAPSYWKLENGAAISRTTYSALLGVLAPVVPCTITNGSSTITGISSTVGWGTGWIIESPGSSALGIGRSIATIGGSSITIAGGAAVANATSCQIFPYGTAQDGTFYLPNAAGVLYAGLDTSFSNLNTTYCPNNPAAMNAFCGAQNVTLAQSNLPNVQIGLTGSISAQIAGQAANGVPGNQVPVGFASGASNAFASTQFAPITINLAGSNTLSINGGVLAAPVNKLPPLRIRNRIIFAGAP